ncbi:hypothetical protein [Campylobacter sp.]|uniref:hypothetical protein n=1 Tax=Campylobacter sp. TaxID=205 RepID=UPI002A833028|nr:hypothetical protein [Campylobacter sp.]MDY4445039.1 hypothetical protein [Campylobacter sp.]
MNNVALENVKDFAFLADRSYRDVKSIEDKEYKPSKHLPKEGTITNPATNSSFEVVKQVNDDTTGFSGTVFKDPVSGEYTIAFRGTEIGNEKISA